MNFTARCAVRASVVRTQTHTPDMDYQGNVDPGFSKNAHAHCLVHVALGLARMGED